MKSEQMIEELTACLHRDVDALGAMPDTPTGRRTLRRLRDVAEHAPVFFHILVEPLLEEGQNAGALAIVTECARVHLYARVLDDALDENLPLDRRNLLRIQPLFWRAVYTLAAQFPAQLDATGALMRTTVDAVEADDERPDPGMWAPKNFHLLLAPLLLSGDSTAYRAALPGLAALIAVAQACEELEQGRVCSFALRDGLARSLVAWLDTSMVETLRQHGWHRAAGRLVADGSALLSRMSRLPITS